jgi:methanogenic corrinoid protein MtbC1
MASVATPLDRFVEALLAVDRVKAQEILSKALLETNLANVVSTLVAPALERIGGEWEKGRVGLSEIYMSSRICEELIRTLPPLGTPRTRNQPKTAIVALLDYHLLGKKMVQLVLRSAGYELLDYGQGVGVDELVQRVRSDHVEVLLISTLMLPSALKVRVLRDKLDQLGVHLKIVVGGAPFRFDLGLWREVGADAMGVNASDALKIMESISREGTRAA